jgi:signal transduction histidine kinase/CheY-like chemotaxis protein
LSNQKYAEFSMPVTDIHIDQTKTEILSRLLEMSEALLRGDYSKRVITDFDDGIITKIADNFNQFADKAQLNTIDEAHNQEQTVNSFIEVISSFANLDFKQKLPISDNGTIMDAIATGINVLGDELEHSTASKQELESERNRLNEAQAIAKVGSWELLIPSLQLNWSKEAYRICELAPQSSDTLFEAFRERFHPEDLIKFDRVIKNTLEKNEPFIMEYRLICPDSGIKYILSIGEVVKNESGIASRWKGTIQDITERKLFEKNLRKAKENAEEANMAKSTFLANMSHEIRTPLNGILGLAEVMLAETTQESHRNYLEIIRSSGKNLSQLINDILDFSKIESGKLVLENISFNFKEVIATTITPYKFLAEQKGLSLVCHIDNAIPEELIGDPMRISQVVTNLVGNAIKFTDEGSIDIALSLSESKAGEVVIRGEVKDTGVGILKEKEKLIFQSFTQADETVTRKFGGTGLGLSIVKSLLLLMKGDIAFVSPADVEHNRGSVFTFTLTLKAPEKMPVQEQANSADKESMTFGRPLHILIVDDNQVNLLVAKKMVKRFGAEVSTAENGFDAINLVKANDYDMVLMDIQMPEINGYETTVELRKFGYTKPIIALSANAYSEDVRKSFESGMNDHMQKPYTLQQLFQRMNKFL